MVNKVAVGQKVRAAKINEIIDQLAPNVFTRTATDIGSSSTFAALALGTAVGGADFSHAAGVYTCLRAGFYEARLTLSFEANATNIRGARMLGSGSLGTRAQVITALSASLDQTMSIGWVVSLAVNDTITAQAFQNSGGNLEVAGHIVFARIT